jgi:SAM-dependent methyltransferase
MIDLFATSEMALGYAASRPAVHEQIVARAKRHLPSTFRRALDVGCGCGLSTRALQGLAQELYGVERIVSMALLAPTVVPDARFVAGTAEALPFASGSADLITAAGSLNYVDFQPFLAEAERVLSPDGLLLVYDFGQGKQSSTAPDLLSWFTTFEQRYPAPSGEARMLDPTTLRRLCRGFRVIAEDCFTVGVPMSRRQYIEYVLTETNVPAAVRNGANLAAIRGWCEDTLRSAWPGTDATAHEVLFPSYFVGMARPR